MPRAGDSAVAAAVAHKPAEEAGDQDSCPRSTDDQKYSAWSQTDLIARITHLESQLREQQAHLSQLLPQTSIAPLELSTSSASQKAKKPKAPLKPFDFSSHPTRRVALKFSYLGSAHNGFEHANGTLTPLPTVEEVLWKALRKTRLIDPPIPDGADVGYDVVWDTRERSQKYGNGPGQLRLDINWEGCEYSKCGRTDRGVSAFGQVIGIRLRSRAKAGPDKSVRTVSPDPNTNYHHDPVEEPSVSAVAATSNSNFSNPLSFELPYASLLNSVLPPSLRIHAVSLDPPADFDARFSCLSREYRYFFTNPAFPSAHRHHGTQTGTRFDTNSAKAKIDGTLDIAAMRQAAKRLEGLHDFRHFCKVDPSKPNLGFERRISFADLHVVDDRVNGTGVSAAAGDRSTPPSKPRTSREWEQGSDCSRLSTATNAELTDGKVKVYAFVVRGSAFLWHQVRCMVAVLFLVGQGSESPDVVDRLLDVDSLENRGRGRPEYLMADEKGLVLWECRFGARRSVGVHGDGGGVEGAYSLSDGKGLDDGTHEEGEGKEVLNWTYLGDPAITPSLPLGYSGKARGNGRYGLGGIVDETWAVWRGAKMNEVLAGQLWGLISEQGWVPRDLDVLHNTSTARGLHESTWIFDGSDRGRSVGRYLPIMQRARMDTPEEMRRKYVEGKGARRERKVNGGGEEGHAG